MEQYIENQKTKRKLQNFSVAARLRRLKDKFFLINIGPKSVYLWHSRKFEEFAYMILPRFLYLTGAAYIIYTINYNQRQNAKWKNYVTSHRQEAVSSQYEQIEAVLQPQVNQFEPGKQVQFDKNYTGDNLNYRYMKEEQEL